MWLCIKSGGGGEKVLCGTWLPPTKLSRAKIPPPPIHTDPFKRGVRFPSLYLRYSPQRSRGVRGERRSARRRRGKRRRRGRPRRRRLRRQKRSGRSLFALLLRGVKHYRQHRQISFVWVQTFRRGRSRSAHSFFRGCWWGRFEVFFFFLFFSPLFFFFDFSSKFKKLRLARLFTTLTLHKPQRASPAPPHARHCEEVTYAPLLRRLD